MVLIHATAMKTRSGSFGCCGGRGGILVMKPRIMKQTMTEPYGDIAHLAYRSTKKAGGE
jgi:hypothetical protein